MSADWGPVKGWDALFGQDEVKAQLATIKAFVDGERASGPVYPPPNEVFRALELTPLSQVKVVILGQDPYPTEGNAHGLAFSSNAAETPPSLRNIYKELIAEGFLTQNPTHNNLEYWAQQGVLLLNTALTFAPQNPKGHLRPWGKFTDAVIRLVDAKQSPVVFVFWGKPAKGKEALLTGRHPVIRNSHPSPQGAYRGFTGSRPFAQMNEALADAKLEPIDWSIPERPKGPTPKG